MAKAKQNNLSGRGVQSVEIAGRILSAFLESGQQMMLKDLAQKVELTPGQAHAYLLSLRKIELVEQDPASGRYRLGPMALHLGLARMRYNDAYTLASEAVVAFAEDIGMMVAITLWGTHGPTIVRVQESLHQIHANVRAGNVFTVTGTATGRLFAAYLPRKLVEPIVDAELSRTSTARPEDIADAKEKLFASLPSVRGSGMAVTVDKPVPGISAIAAPVFDFSGQIRLAITLVAPTASLDITLDGPHAKALRAFSADLSSQLGYIPPDS